MSMSHKLCFVSPNHRMSTSQSTWQLGKACNLHELSAGCTLQCIRMTRFGPKGDKSGIFSDLSEPKYTKICSEKVPDLSHLGPIWPTLGLISLHISISKLFYHFSFLKTHKNTKEYDLSNVLFFYMLLRSAAQSKG